MEYKIDPELEKCLPPLAEDKYQLLKLSISKGYDPAKPMVLWKERPGTIVDGHHRYRACLELGVEPITIEEPFESLDMAVLYTLHRQTEQRDLTAAQKIMIAEQMITIEERLELARTATDNRLKNLKRGDVFPERPSGERSGTEEFAKKIAEKAGTCRGTVYATHAVQARGTPELRKFMESGEIGAREAGMFLQLEPNIEKQAEIINTGGLRMLKDIVNEHRKELRKDHEAKKDAVEKTIREEAEADRKFQEERDSIKQDVQEYHAVQEKKFGGAKYACGLSSIFEMWCNSCKCAFDIFKPHEATVCPACGDNDIGTRDELWYPGKKVE